MQKLFPAIFLDRDGTLNHDPGYINRPEDFELFSGVGETLKRLQDLGYKLIVVTNQSGIARGFLSEETLQEIHKKLWHDLEKFGVALDALYYCPHHPDENCACRKPQPGMVLRAAKDHHIDLARSWVVGDSAADEGLAQATGCRFIRVTADQTFAEVVERCWSELVRLE